VLSQSSPGLAAPKAASPSSPGLRGGRLWSPQPRWWVGVALIAPLLLVIAVLVVWPVVRLGALAMPDGLGLGSFQQYFSNAARFRALEVTFRDSALVAVLAVGIGYVLAWPLVVSRSRLLKGLIWLAVLLPFMMGTVVKNYAWLILLQRRGLINTALIKAGILSAPLPLLYNEFAVVVGILYTLLPYAVIPIFTTLRTIDLDMVRAAETLGATRTRAVLSIVVPLSAASAGAIGLLIFVISLGFYVVPVILGGATSPFMSTMIENDMVQFFDLKSAAIASIVLVALSSACVGLGLLTVGSDSLRKAAGSR
jgi:mannopine transport system permease protein